MKIFNYRITRIGTEQSIKDELYDAKEHNAITGLIGAKLELTLHSLLLKQIEVIPPEGDEKESETQREARLTEEAIERDKRSIKNWETQLRAINYERNT